MCHVPSESRAVPHFPVWRGRMNSGIKWRDKTSEIDGDRGHRKRFLTFPESQPSPEKTSRIPYRCKRSREMGEGGQKSGKVILFLRKTRGGKELEQISRKGTKKTLRFLGQSDGLKLNAVFLPTQEDGKWNTFSTCRVKVYTDKMKQETETTSYEIKALASNPAPKSWFYGHTALIPKRPAFCFGQH